MACLFVGELPIRWRRMSRGVSYYQKCDCFSKAYSRWQHETSHYNDIIMGAMASQNTSFTIVYSAVYSGEDQRKYQSSESLAFVRGIHRWPMNSPPIGPVTRTMFPFDDVIMRKLSIIGPMLGNHRSSVDSPYKGPATREAFWCHCVMMQAQCWHNSGGLWVWGRAWADIRRVDVGSGHMIERAISENYTSHMVSSCCNT